MVLLFSAFAGALLHMFVCDLKYNSVKSVCAPGHQPRAKCFLHPRKKKSKGKGKLKLISSCFLGLPLPDVMFPVYPIQ